MVRHALRALPAALVVLAACIPQLGAGGDGAGAGAGGTSGASGAVDGGDGGMQTYKCANDPVTRVQLCTALSVCPDIVVNHTVLPHCGMRIRGQWFDLACWCDGWVCPLGEPSTCTEARSILSAAFEEQVCNQVNEGRCTQPQKDGADGGAGGATTGAVDPNKGCNMSCLATCGTAPACREACGCVSF